MKTSPTEIAAKKSFVPPIENGHGNIQLPTRYKSIELGLKISVARQ